MEAAGDAVGARPSRSAAAAPASDQQAAGIQLKELLPSPHAVMLTVYEDPDHSFRALRAGASGYLLKRSSPDEVINALREVQQGGGAMSGEIARKVIGYFREQAAATAEVDQHTAREREVLELVVHGMSNREITDMFFVAPPFD